MNLVYSQDFSRILSVTEIRINGSIWTGNREEIIVGSQDSIEFIYELLSPSLSQDKFLYRIVLKDDRDSSIRNSSSKSASFKNLPEGKWIFEIGAHDLNGKWAAIPFEVLIDVDDKKSIVQDEYISIIDNYYATTNYLGEPKVSLTQKVFSLQNILILSAVLILAAISVLFFIFKPKEQSKSSEDDMASKDGNVNREEFEKLESENIALRAEIAALRGQIGAMQSRSEELQKQNAEMQKNLAKIETSKDELEELQKQKDELFAVIIHDIKNPVSLIKSLVELLSNYDLTATEQQEVIEDIAQTTLKIVSLSQEVSKVLSFESNRLNMNFDKHNVTDIAEDVYHRNLVAAKKKDIQMNIEIESNLPESILDPQKIDEVIDNLISNAIKFTQPGGSVLLKAEKDGDNIQISISDNGLGLSESDIREAFKRGSKLTARPTGGESSTGLGLWIVKKLIEAHHGRVWVKSALGKGSTFYVTLPIEQVVTQQ